MFEKYLSKIGKLFGKKESNPQIDKIDAKVEIDTTKHAEPEMVHATDIPSISMNAINTVTELQAKVQKLTEEKEELITKLNAYKKREADRRRRRRSRQNERRRIQAADERIVVKDNTFA